MKLHSHLIVLVLDAMLPVLAFSTIMTAVSWRHQRAGVALRRPASARIS